MDYQEFLKQKTIINHSYGHECRADLSLAIPFQRPCIEWACQKGRSALFHDTGLGKTFQQLLWSDSVVKETKGKVLVVAPLSVSSQTVREGKKFGIEVNKIRHEQDIRPGINITNYEILKHFNCSQFDGVVIDESSILKNYSGKIRNEIIDLFRYTPYKLACTATPAPNDVMEIGNHAEFLGVMSRSEMLATFFVHDGGETSKWRLKGHAQKDFYKWMASWCLMVKKPSDIGFENGGYDLPPLNIDYHFVDYGSAAQGKLFKDLAVSLDEQRKVRKNSIKDRFDKLKELLTDDQAIIWCDLNDESAFLKKNLNDSIEIKGSDSPEYKEQGIIDFLDGKYKYLISKASIFGFGINAQAVNNMYFFGLNHSYEQFYQSIRRCWRYGQTKPVNVNVIVTEAEQPIIDNIQRKHDQAEHMSNEMIKQMAEFTTAEITKTIKQTTEYKASKSIKLPKWLKG